jgi:hypothetical protein
MNTIVSSLTATAALLASAVAYADPPVTTSTSTTTTTAQPAPQAAPPILTSTPPPISTTRVTSADSTGMQPPPTVATNKDTVTVYESIHPNRAMLYTGGILFLGSYVPTAAITAARMNDAPSADRALYLPIVGPWMHLADANEPTFDTLLIAGSGILQGVGAGLALVSLFVPEKIPAATISAGNVHVNVAPTSFGVASAGLGAAGTF